VTSLKYELLKPNLSVPIFVRIIPPKNVLINNIILVVKTFSKFGVHIKTSEAAYMDTEYTINFLRKEIWNSIYSRITGTGIPRMDKASIFLDFSQSRLKNVLVKCSSIYEARIRGIAKMKEYVIIAGKYLSKRSGPNQAIENHVAAKVGQ